MGAALFSALYISIQWKIPSSSFLFYILLIIINLFLRIISDGRELISMQQKQTIDCLPGGMPKGIYKIYSQHQTKVAYNIIWARVWCTHNLWILCVKFVLVAAAWWARVRFIWRIIGLIGLTYHHRQQHQQTNRHISSQISAVINLVSHANILM